METLTKELTTMRAVINEVLSIQLILI
jgi:hypothetical protein